MAASFPVSIDPRIVPWSYRGSYLCLATRSGNNGRLTPANNDICLISHIYPAGLPLFALRPYPDGKAPQSPPTGFHKDPSPVSFEADPSSLRWIHDGIVLAEATFEDVRTIRLRGSAPFSFDTEGALAVDAWRTWLFRVPRAVKDGPEEVEFTSKPDSALRFVALKGKFDLANEAPSTDTNRRVTISPHGGESTWELVIRERERELQSSGSAIRTGQGEMSFDSAKEAMQGAFSRYAADMCPWQTDWSSPQGQVDQLGAYVMWTSTVRPAGYFKKEAVLMSKLWMNKVWSWDNCFNCLALAVAYPETAIDQMLLPFDWITPEGRLPDSICHSEILYDYTKPPIYGWVLFKLLKGLQTRDDGGAYATSSSLFDVVSKERLTEIYDKVSRNTIFWYTARMSVNSRIPWYSHGNDCGWDNATCFDSQTMVSAPDLAAFLVVQNDWLAQAARHLGHTAEASRWSTKRDDIVTALVDELWGDQSQVFDFKDAYNGERWSAQTLLKFIPLVAAQYLPRTIVEAMVAGLASHMTEWGLATEDPTSSKYESDGYWRGPIWAPPTIIIESGLRQAGYAGLADEISRKYQKLCGRGGFAENHNALTGEGNRDLSYTWSASTYLVLRREECERSSP